MPNKYPWDTTPQVQTQANTNNVKYPWDAQPSKPEAKPVPSIISLAVKKGKDIEYYDNRPTTIKSPPLITGVTTNRGTPVPFNPLKLAWNSKTAGAVTAGLSDSISLGLIPKALQMVDKESVDKAYQQAEKSNPIAYNVGRGAGYVAGGAKIAGAAPIKAVVGKVGSKLGKRIVEGALVGGSMTVAEDLIKGKDLKTIGKDVSINTALGAGIDVALHGAGKLISSIVKKYGKNITPEISKAIEQVSAMEAKPDKTPQEIEDYYAMIDYLDEVNRKSSEYIKNEALLRAPKVNQFNTIGKGAEMKPNKPILSALDAKVNKPYIEAPALKTPPQRIEQPQIKQNSIGSINAPVVEKPFKANLEPQLTKPSKLKKNLNRLYSATVDNTATTAKVSEQAGVMSNVARNAGATVDHIINKGLVNMAGQKIDGKAIKDIFKMPKNEAEALEELLFETHNIDRVHQAKELTGRTTEESKQIIDAITKQYPHLAEKAKEVNTLLTNLLDEWGVKSGLVDSDARNLLKTMYKNYVPGYRVMPDIEATAFKTRGMGPAKIINKAIGGDDKLMSLQKSIPMIINKFVKSARKNELYNEILKAAEKGSEHAKVLEPVGKLEEVVEKNMTESMMEAIKADGIDAIANIADSALSADPKLGYMLTVMKDGKPVKLRISEDLFKSLQALNGKGDDDLQAAIKMFKKTVTNPFKSLITGYNPLFAVRNVARDIPTAYIQGTENNPIKFIGNLGTAAKDMLKKSERFQEYKALGGEGGNYFNVEKGLQQKGKLEKPLKVLGAINNFTETLPRYGEYVGTLKREGADYATKMKALNNAQEVTVNFGKHGDVTKAIDAVVPYLSPAVQGLNKTVQTFKKPEAWAKALGVITIPTAAIYAINQVIDKQGYDQLDSRTKDTYFVFPQGDGKFIKIPKTRESGAVFGALFERILRQVEGQPEAFKGYLGTIKNNFLIQNPWTDNIASPLVSGIGYNTDFAGRDVIPQYMLNDKRSPKLQYDEKTSEIAKAIGNQFNLSPKQIDYIIKSYGGIVANIIQPATTKGGNVVENTLVRPFTADAAYSNEITNGFYKKLDKLKQSATDKNITGNLPSKLVTPEEKMSNLYQGMTRQISDIRDGITKLGATEEARKKQQELLSILTELNKDIDYNQANRLKTQLTIMARQYKK